MIKEFNYNVTGSGWAEASFSDENRNVSFGITALTHPDPLTELFPALTRLFKKRSDSEIIVFFDEPGAHALIITKQQFYHYNRDIPERRMDMGKVRRRLQNRREKTSLC